VPALLDKILRAGEGKTLRRLQGIAEQINTLEPDYVDMTDAELRGETDELKAMLADGKTLDDILPLAFATVREAAKRTLGQRHYDVQLMGGAAMHLGNIAEMKTGEGKTLAGTLPAYLNGLSGNGMHLVTVNDYLAERDAEWMGRVHRFLGLSVGVILSGQRPDERREQYACDITYGTNNEFGFDYLRDNMAWSVKELVQRGHNFAIVDEVDSILVDEARTPLIISGPADKATRWYSDFAAIVPRLRRGDSEKGVDGDYDVDEKKRTVGILESGVEKVEDHLGIENLYESTNTPLVGYLNNALRAKELYKRDRDYVVIDGNVLIVDEHTGRMLPGRRYSEGMHQAIEAKEGVKIKDENQTLATVTLQNYFRLYDKLGGMTGTAMTEASEFSQIYKLGVVQIPTNRPMIRADESDLVYKTEPAKFDAVVEDIGERHEKGQPVLVGTVSVEKSEYLSNQLRKRRVPHEVLNAKYHEREAHIIAQAGRKGAVTVATNMAGRGTDIMLGGNPEFMADAELRQRGLDPVETPEDYEAAWSEALEKAKKSVVAEHDEVTDSGGLYVLGTERHESRRIDNQLRGRSGRQGDPGETRFYLSLGDDLMRLFNAPMVESFLTRFNIPDDVPIESKMVTNAIRSAQTQVEAQNFEIRKNVLKYDEVLNRQRLVIYDERRRVLRGEDLQEQVRHMIDDVVEGYVVSATAESDSEQWDLDQLWTALRTLYPISLSLEDVKQEQGSHAKAGPSLVERIKADAQAAYDRREEQLGADALRELERRVVLSVLDRKWREHLYEMDYLKEGIGLRAMAQRDPLVEFQREGYTLFAAMMDAIKEESIGFLNNLEVQVKQDTPGEGAEGPDAAQDAGQDSGVAGGPAGAAAPDGDARDTAPSKAPAPAGTSGAPADDAAREPVGAGAGGPAPGARRPTIIAKGLVAPRRPAQLQYSAPTVDGEGGVAQTDGSATDGSRDRTRTGSNGAAAPVGPPGAGAAGTGGGDGSNRAQRRRAAKQQGRRRR
jgi:preprotein translocase subunit SecA